MWRRVERCHREIKKILEKYNCKIEFSKIDQNVFLIDKQWGCNVVIKRRCIACERVKPNDGEEFCKKCRKERGIK